MSLLSRLRGRAMHSRSRADRAFWTRALLRNKAKLGRWDDRMLNGHPSHINHGCRAAVMRGVAAGLVVTSTTDGRHAATSLHPSGAAVDLGLPAGEVGTQPGRSKLEAFQRKEHWRHRRGKLPTLLELIGPDNRLVVLRARETDLVEGSALETQHDNHCHEGHSR